MTQEEASFSGAQRERALQHVPAVGQASLTLGLHGAADPIAPEASTADDAVGFFTNFSNRDAARTPRVLQQGHALISSVED